MSWLFASPIRIVLVAVAIVVVPIAAFIAAGYIYYVATRTTTGEIDALIRRNLVPGATTEEIFEFLDRENLEHLGVSSAGSDSLLLDAGYAEDTEVIWAVYPNSSRAFVTTGDIVIYFILDEEGRYKEHYLKEIFTSL
jgi:hypothetical protein